MTKSLQALLLTALLATPAAAQTTTTLTTPTAPLATPAPVTANAVVQTPGAAPLVMPLNVQLLPYGTIELAPGTYFIPNFENTGISVYLQSPKPIRIATLEETLRFQAEWARLTRDVYVSASTGAAAPVAASPTSFLQPVGAAPARPAAASWPPPAPTQPVAQAPAALQGPALPPLPAAPAPAPVALAAPPAAPVASPPTPAFPVYPAYATAAPTAPSPTLPSAPPAAPALAYANPYLAPAAAPTGYANPYAASPYAALPSAPQAMAPAPTLVPQYLQVNFKGRGNGATFMISNTSEGQALQIDPGSLRVYQGQQQVKAELTVRDSSSGRATGTLLPRSALIGTLKVTASGSSDPLTITWQARDMQGATYPITYSWLPR